MNNGLYIKAIKKTIIAALSILFTAMLTLTVAVFTASAEEEIAPPAVTMTLSGGSIQNGTRTIEQGKNVCIYVRANKFVKVAALELTVVYDSQAFSAQSLSVGTFANKAVYSLNKTTDEESGEQSISFTYASSAGLSGNGILFKFYLYSAANTATGNYRVNVYPGICKNADFQDISITQSSAAFAVKEKTVQLKSLNIYAQTNITSTAIKKGDEIEVSYCTNNANDFCAASFEVNFDNTVLSLKSAELSSALMQKNGALASKNDSVNGYVRISYASIEPNSGSCVLLTVKLFAAADVTSVSDIEFAATELKDSEMNGYNEVRNNITVKTEKMPEEVILPKIYLSAAENCSFANGKISISKRDFSLKVVAERDTALAAGDFKLSFDKSTIICSDIVPLNGYTVIGNPDRGDGLATFSFICQNGITQDSEIAEISFRVKAVVGSDISVGFTGSGFVDKDFNAVKAETECPEAIFAPEADIYSAALLLDGTLGIKFRVGFSSFVGGKYSVAAESDGSGVTVEQLILDDSKDQSLADNYYFVVRLAAKQMTDAVKVSIKADGETITSSEYSVRNYVDAVLKLNGYDKLKALMLAMVDYGAKAQIYFGYHTDRLANDGLENLIAENVPSSDIPDGKIDVGGKLTDINPVALLSLESSTRLILALRGVSDPNTLIVTVNGNAVDNSSFKLNSDGRLDIADIGVAAKNLSDIYEIKVISGSETLTVKFSVMIYAYTYNKNYAESPNENQLKMIALNKALYGYYMTAQEYFYN